ncbi:unnamed protein product [Brugia pahangi]|uniref:Uncharacterized protein n=1 Tax=Brugia pahangi TaxID=6280 RepID=A0A0N4TVG6_BRUPA|nr:unnamed protein product [Brugia pahangi]
MQKPTRLSSPRTFYKEDAKEVTFLRRSDRRNNSPCWRGTSEDTWEEHAVRTHACNTTTTAAAVAVEAKLTRALPLLQRTFRDIDMPPHRV